MKHPSTLIEHRPAVYSDMVVGRANPEHATRVSAGDQSMVREHQYALERRWRRFRPSPVTATGFERYDNPLLPQAGADCFTQGGAPEGGLTQVLQTLPFSAVMEERSRLAREIHDTLVQEFAGILLHLEAAKGSDDGEWCTNSECLACARELAKCGLEDARRMLLNLRPKSLEGATLPDALQQLTERFSRDCGINCTFRATGRAHDLPVEVQDELYRVAQEALCNVRKHSRATCASLSLCYGSDVAVMKIEDNGQGFATIEHQAGGHGYGFSTMRERAHRLGGRVPINSAPGQGTEVTISVPFPGKKQVERKKQ